MSDEAKKTEKTSWFQGLKAEFKNISWPDRKTLIRETITVTVVSVVLVSLLQPWIWFSSMELIFWSSIKVKVNICQN